MIFNALKKKVDISVVDFIRHSFNYISSTVVVKLVSLLLLLFLTHFLSTYEYGKLSVFLSVFSVLLILFSLGSSGAVSRYYYEKNNDFGKFLFSTLVLLILAGILFFICMFIFNNSLGNIIGVSGAIILWAALSALFFVYFEIFKSFLQASKKSFLLSKLMVVKSIAIFILSIIFTSRLYEQKFYGTIYAFFIVSLVLAFFSLYKMYRVAVFKFRFRYAKYLLAFGIPVVFHLIASYILNSFDQIMINSLIGSSQTGLYSLAYNIGMMVQLLVMGLNQAWVPMFYEFIVEKRWEKINNLARYISIIISIFSLLLVFVVPYFLKLIIPEKFLGAFEIIPVVVIGFLFQFLYVLNVNYVFYKKETFNIAFITVFVSVVNISLNFIFIPRFGAIAAAWTTVISYFILFLSHFINVHYVIRMKNVVPLKIIGFPVAIAVVLIMIKIIIF